MKVHRSSTNDSLVLSGTVEAYLRAIYELAERGDRPRQAHLAEALGVSPPAVSVAVRRLAELGLVVRRGHLVLTGCGESRARGVVRRHRLAQRLFVDIVGMDVESARAEADRWAHVISDRAERKLFHRLGGPRTDPSGATIPDHDELVDTIGTART